MKKHKISSAQIGSYAAMAGLVLASDTIFSQIIYTDIDPDTVLDNHMMYYNLDLDNNGITDFAFEFAAGSIGTAGLAFPYNTNSVAGYGTIVAGSWSSNFLSVLNTGAAISSGNNWISEGVRMFSVYWMGEVGPWVAQTDKFAALKLHAGGNIYYGWVRLSTTKDPGSMIIKDYAYNGTAGKPIHTLNTDAVQNTDQQFSPDVYVFDKKLYVHLPVSVNESILSVYDLQGKLLLAKNISDLLTIIDMHDFPAGGYVIKLLAGTETYSTVKIVE